LALAANFPQPAFFQPRNTPPKVSPQTGIELPYFAYSFPSPNFIPGLYAVSAPIPIAWFSTSKSECPAFMKQRPGNHE
jgi:hypothetical protein